MTAIEDVEVPDGWEEMSLVERLACLPDDLREVELASLTDSDLESPEFWLRPQQYDVVVSDEWITIFAAGRGAGKTRTGAVWVNKRAKAHPRCRIALIGRTVADVRDVMINGESGIIASSESDFIPVYTPSLRKLEWPNGSTAYTYSADAPSQLRGPQQHFAWCDELAAFPVTPDTAGTTAWDNVLLSTRLGEAPQILVTTTPKRTTVMRDLFRQALAGDSRVVVFQTSTLANRANLSPEYIKAVFDKYSDTHLERQELWGELIGDAPGALWRSDDIVIEAVDTETPVGVLIGVDPAISNSGGDDTGIVIIAYSMDPDPLDRRAWVLEDLTFNGPPDRWARVIVEAQRRYEDYPQIVGEPIVVVEGNQGGELLRLVLQQQAPGIPIAIVKAIKSKAARAEPVVMAYRQKRVFHVDEFPLLTDEMTGWEPDSKWSPGALDANVWAINTALVDPRPLWPLLPIKVVGRPPATESMAITPAFRRDPTRGVAIGLGPAPWRR